MHYYKPNNTYYIWYSIALQWIDDISTIKGFSCNATDFVVG